MNDASSGFKAQSDEHLLARERLAEYAAVKASGATGAAMPADLGAHLRSCTQCRRWYAEAQMLAHDVYSANVEAAKSYPSFDLGFLTTPRLKSRISSIDSLIVSLPASLLQLLRGPQLAGALRGASLFHDRIEEIERINVAVTVEIAAKEQQDVASVRVDCEVLSREPDDQAGTRVLFRSGNILREDETDAAGTVVFAGVQLDLLPKARIEVLPDHKR